MFPKANDLETYWQNILKKVDAIEEIPIGHWDWREFYDADPLAPDKIISRWGGFLQEIDFDPTIYGIPPNVLKSIDPMQILLLEVTRAAVADAGYTNRSFPKQNASVILANAGQAPISALYSLRSMLGWKLSELPDDVKDEVQSRLPDWSEDSFAGYLGNVTAGRVANRFDLGGVNFCIDAACASSLAALYVSLGELRSRNSDIVFLCATDTHNQPGDYLSFSKTHALSSTGRCRAFDASADGIVISEGIATLVLKRLGDAERDGDKIYAVVRSVAGSSDGRGLSLTAPSKAGQVLALNRAFEAAGVCPSTVSLIEAHGTGTVAGDKAEIEALKQVFQADGANTSACAIGSVKTMIGHTKAAAGLASLIKVAKALHHKVLPPTLGVTTPNPTCDFANSPFYVNSELRPWLNMVDGVSGSKHPRRAGVSAFGFGGTNFHAILEEYVPALPKEQESTSQTWTAELFITYGTSRANLFDSISWLSEQVESATRQNHNDTALKDLAHKLHLRNQKLWELPSRDLKQKSAWMSKPKTCLTVVATGLQDLQTKLIRAKSDIQDSTKNQIKDLRGVYYFPHQPSFKVAFLFPGEGSQRVNMLSEATIAFPEVRMSLESASDLLASKLEKPLANYIFPPPAFTEAERATQEMFLNQTRIALPAMGAANIAMLRLLESLNVIPDMVAGRGCGEYVALCAAGSISQSEMLSNLASCGTGEHISAPVNFLQEIQNMYADGAKVFVECGPNAVLTDLVSSILDQPKFCDHLAVSVDRNERDGILQLLHTLAQLAAYGVPVNPGILYRGRIKDITSVQEETVQMNSKKKKKLLYRVNSTNITPVVFAGNGLSEAVGKVPSSSPNAISAYVGAKAEKFAVRNERINQSISGISFSKEKNADKDSRVDQAAFFSSSLLKNSSSMPNQVPKLSCAVPAAFATQDGMQEVDRLVTNYQQVMLQIANSFMDSQRNVMTSYLQTGRRPNSQPGQSQTDS